ncbi:MAG: hypothetical protein SF187_23505 [Deltaproteobacteria bacterium]|nr:hypothetical protein [Deltaproteobacteria bacterium]
MADSEAKESDSGTWALIKSVAHDSGQWIWGTVEGQFNEKASTSQIIVDAVISLIPLVGDVTAARDLIAVSIGLIDDPKKREDKMQWVMLVLLTFALIPVIGGAIKGVGRLALKAVEEAAHLASASARTAKFMEVAKDMVAFLNHVGKGSAEKWLLSLRVAEHQARVVQELNKFFDTFLSALAAVERRLHLVIPDSVLARIKWLRDGLKKLKELVSKYVPDAIQELDQKLREIQQFVHEGGQITSRAASHTVAVGAENMSRVEQARLVQSVMSEEVSFTGHVSQNSSKVGEFDSVYKHEAGFPDVAGYKEKGHAPNIQTYGGKIVNKALEPGEQIFRVFGPEGVTRGKLVRGSMPAGNRSVAFWGYGAPPANAKAWRYGSAVLDEWNRDGYILVGRIESPNAVKAAIGKISKQRGRDLKSQILTGGDMQAMIEFSPDVTVALNDLGARAVASGKAETLSIGGVVWEVKPTGWNDVNGIHGYVRSHQAESLAVSVCRLSDDEPTMSEE